MPCSAWLCGLRQQVGGSTKRSRNGALQAAVGDPQARAFYEARQWQPAWDGKSEQALVDIIAEAPGQWPQARPVPRRRAADDPNGRDAALTKAALGYASALARGYVDPTKLGRIYTIPRPRRTLPPASRGRSTRTTLPAGSRRSRRRPTNIARSSEAHLQFLSGGGRKYEARVPGRQSRSRPGSRDPRVPRSPRPCAANGYLNAPPEGQTAPSGGFSATRYTARYVARRATAPGGFGLKPDGMIGPDTLDALNAGAGYRARQLGVAMERLRWLRARSARHPDRRQYRAATSSIIGATAAYRSAATSSTASPTSRRRKSRRLSFSWSPTPLARSR